MKLKIKDIGPSGRDVTWDLAAAELQDLLRTAAVEPLGQDASAQVRLRFERTSDDELLARGALRASFFVPCGRCLGPAAVTLDEPDVAVTFVSAQPEQLAELELSLEDPATYAFAGDELDLAPLLREALVLAIPIAPVCQETCRGLCSGCGADLNVEPCRCEGAPTDSPWQAALKRIKQEGR